MDDNSLRLNILTSSLEGQDATRRKLAMDALRNRLSAGQDKDAKLKEACEGFESIFIGKLWQQMRQTVPKEGYLHSQYEDAYVSMFDTEMAKKMAQAGGIGLGDMLYRELQEQNAKASRVAPSEITDPLPIKPLKVQASGGQPPAAPEAEAEGMDPASLYSPLEGYEGYEEAKGQGEAAELARQRVAAPDPLAESQAPVKDASPEMLADIETLARLIQNRRGPAPTSPADLSGAVQAQTQAYPSMGGGPTPKANNAPPLRNDISPESPLPFVTPAALTPGASSAVGAAASAEPGEAVGGTNETPDMLWPVAGSVGSGFGWRTDPLTGSRQWHPGVDISGEAGDPVAACWSGKVIFSGPSGSYGNLVVLEHNGGWRSYYGHNQDNLVAPGDLVQAGQKIASMGSTGQSTGPHLHFELRQEDQAVDPVRIRRQLLANNPIDRARERG